MAFCFGGWLFVLFGFWRLDAGVNQMLQPIFIFNICLTSLTEIKGKINKQLKTNAFCDRKGKTGKTVVGAVEGVLPDQGAQDIR
jgi:hypothetical protein